MILTPSGLLVTRIVLLVCIFLHLTQVSSLGLGFLWKKQANVDEKKYSTKWTMKDVLVLTFLMCLRNISHSKIPNNWHLKMKLILLSES